MLRLNHKDEYSHFSHNAVGSSSIYVTSASRLQRQRHHAFGAPTMSLMMKVSQMERNRVMFRHQESLIWLN